MRRTETQKLSDVIKEYLKENHLDKKLNTARVSAHWEELMGKFISSNTSNIFIKEKTLFLKLKSPALKNELLMTKGKIISMMNRKMEGNYIEKIVFL